MDSTIQPLPRCSAVTSGVPSASLAQVRSDNWIEGSARIWRDTVTSGGTDNPPNGLESEKPARCCGSAQASEPPR